MFSISPVTEDPFCTHYSTCPTTSRNFYSGIRHLFRLYRKKALNLRKLVLVEGLRALGVPGWAEDIPFPSQYAGTALLFLPLREIPRALKISTKNLVTFFGQSG